MSFIPKWIFVSGLMVLILLLSNCGSSESEQTEEASTIPHQNELAGPTLESETGLSEEQLERYHRVGAEVAGMTFSALNTALMSAMQGDSAVFDAIEYCHLAAMPITDSLAGEYGVQVQRLAERNRNAENAISIRADAEIFDTFKNTPEDELRNAETVRRLSDGSVVFYKAIPLQPQCMICHGPVSTIGDANYSAITALYPNDKAVGFRAGELRGMWKITLARN